MTTKEQTDTTDTTVKSGKLEIIKGIMKAKAYYSKVTYRHGYNNKMNRDIADNTLDSLLDLLIEEGDY